jgi:hypothetical protein
MKTLWIIVLAFIIFGAGESFCQVVPKALPTAAPAPTATPLAMVAPTPVVAPTPAPAPIQAKAPMTGDSTEAVQPVVIKDVDMAPPTWMQDIMVSIKKLPYIGPIITKAIQWVCVLFTILTALCGFILLVLKSLAGISTLGNLQHLADVVENFQNGKIMYWLKYASAFNAKKVVVVQGAQPDQAAV